MILSAAATTIYCFAALLANLVWAAMGFGNAIMFLLIFQLADFTSVLEPATLKYTVFLQCINLLPGPVFMALTHHRQIISTFHWRLVVPCLVSQMGMVYFGQYVQKNTRTVIIRLVIGTVVLAMTALKVFNKYFHKLKETASNCQDIELDTKKQKTKAIFIIGSQHSGSNRLRSMLNTYDSLTAPESLHILTTFFPVVEKYGNLDLDANFKLLISHVTGFTEQFVCGQFTSTAVGNANVIPIQFKIADVFERSRGSRTLVSIFEVLYDTITEARGKTTWCCELTDSWKYHDQLKSHFGDRLHYIYLHRDPRDVCMSYRKEYVEENYHYYSIAATWNNLQQHCISILKSDSATFELRYEQLLKDKQMVMDDLFQFLNVKLGSNRVKFTVDMESRNNSETSNGMQCLVGSSRQQSNDDSDDNVSTEDLLTKWRTPDSALTAQDLLDIETGCHESLDYLGYTRTNAGILRYNDDQLNGRGMADTGKVASLDYMDRQRHQCKVLKLIESAEIQKFHEYKYIWAWAMLFGSMAGFLGGLIGAKGPALIIFFLCFPFDKGVVRTTGITTSFVNLIVRSIGYALTAPPADDFWTVGAAVNTTVTNGTLHHSWFIEEEWPLYLGLVVSALFGCLGGAQIHKKLTPGSFDSILIGLLIICGVSMLVKAAVNML